MKNLVKKLREAESLEDYESASKACLEYFANASEAERSEIRQEMIAKGDELMRKAKESRKKAAELISEYENSQVNIEIDGRVYPLSEWVTLKEYCRRFGLKNTMVVNNWINRQIIPKENIINISQLNDLRLIKAVPYK